MSLLSARFFFWSWLLIVAVFAVLSLQVAPVAECSDCRLYIKSADRLIALDFDWTRLAQEFSTGDFDLTLYLTWLISLALVKLQFGAAWPLGVVLFNLLCAGVTVLLVGAMVRVERGKERLVLAGFVLLALGTVDYALWIRYILSDISFALLSTAVFFLATWRGSRVLPLLGAVVVALLTFFHRPVGLVVAVWLLLLLAAKPVLSDGKEGFSRSPALLALGVFLVVFLLFVGWWAAVMQDPQLWPSHTYREWITFLSGRFHDGIVVDARPETNHGPPGAWLDFVLLALDRVLRFFQPTAGDFSTAHNALNLGVVVPNYGLALFALLRAFSRESALSGEVRWRLLWGFVLLVTYATFHGLQELDFDFRYRVPCMPILFFMGAVGLGEMVAMGRRRVLIAGI